MGPEALLRKACELSYVIARDGVEADPPIEPPRPMRSFLYVADLPDRGLEVAPLPDVGCAAAQPVPWGLGCRGGDCGEHQGVEQDPATHGAGTREGLVEFHGFWVRVRQRAWIAASARARSASL